MHGNDPHRERRFGFWLIVLLAALLTPSAHAAEGGSVETYGRADGTAFYLCDGRAAPAACATFNAAGQIERYVRFETHRTTGCTSYSVDIQQRLDSSGDVWHTIGTLTNTGVTAIGVAAPIAAQLRGNITALSGCTDLEVVVEFLRFTQ